MKTAALALTLAACAPAIEYRRIPPVSHQASAGADELFSAGMAVATELGLTVVTQERASGTIATEWEREPRVRFRWMINVADGNVTVTSQCQVITEGLPSCSTQPPRRGDDARLLAERIARRAEAAD